MGKRDKFLDRIWTYVLVGAAAIGTAFVAEVPRPVQHDGRDEVSALDAEQLAVHVQLNELLDSSNGVAGFYDESLGYEHDRIIIDIEPKKEYVIYEGPMELVKPPKRRKKSADRDLDKILAWLAEPVKEKDELHDHPQRPEADLDYVDADTGIALSGMQAYDDDIAKKMSKINASLMQGPQDSCHDHIDNDADGPMDMADPDCWRVTPGVFSTHVADIDDLIRSKKGIYKFIEVLKVPGNVLSSTFSWYNPPDFHKEMAEAEVKVASAEEALKIPYGKMTTTVVCATDRGAIICKDGLESCNVRYDDNCNYADTDLEKELTREILF